MSTILVFYRFSVTRERRELLLQALQGTRRPALLGVLPPDGDDKSSRPRESPPLARIDTDVSVSIHPALPSGRHLDATPANERRALGQARLPLEPNAAHAVDAASDVSKAPPLVH
jgi:hypothetical protein